MTYSGAQCGHWYRYSLAAHDRLRRGTPVLFPKIATERCGNAGINRPPSPTKCPQFFHTLHPRATLCALPLPDGSRTFRCRREGMPPCGPAQTSARATGGGGGQRGSAGGRRSFGSGVQSQPPGRGPAFCLGRKPQARRETGAGLWRTCPASMRAGSVPEPRPKQLPRPVRAAAGATRAEGPEEGRVSKPAPCDLQGCRLSDGDAIRRVPGRALSAPPMLHSFRRHCPRAALRTSTAITPRR